MLTEISCGAVVFTKDDGYIKYVIVESKAGVCGFPKGHMEGSETEKETALREILEETGLTVDIIDSFRTQDSYTFVSNGRSISKSVVYFLAEYSAQIPTVQIEELNGIRLMCFEDAVSVLRFDSSKRILSEANTFLENMQHEMQHEILFENRSL